MMKRKTNYIQKEEEQKNVLQVLQLNKFLINPKILNHRDHKL